MNIPLYYFSEMSPSGEYFAEEILLICRRQEAHKQCLNQNIVYEWKGIKNA